MGCQRGQRGLASELSRVAESLQRVAAGYYEALLHWVMGTSNVREWTVILGIMTSYDPRNFDPLDRVTGLLRGLGF